MDRVSRTCLVVAAALLAGMARGDGFQDTSHRRATLVSAAWDVGVPLADLRDFADAPAYRGAQFEIRRGVFRRVSAGLATSWSWFAQSFASRSVEYANATVSGPLYQRVRLATVRATAHVYLTGGALQPYLGAGAGAVSWETYRNLGGAVETRSGWAAVADPEVGVLWTVRNGLAFHVQARLLASRARFSGVEDARWLGIHVGLAGY